MKRIHDGYLILNAIEHLNYQVNNQYQSLQGATIGASLATFNIDDFHPKPNQKIDLLNALTGLGAFFGAASGLVPMIGPGLGAARSLLPAIGTYIGRAIDSKDTEVAQKTFAPKVQEMYRSYVSRIDDLGQALFNGSELEGLPDFNITSVLLGGGWIERGSLSRITDVETQVKAEILSRCIDALGETPTNNKMWVLFVDLQEGNSTARCSSDLSGPQDSKYCADGGVYYTYNFIETGNLIGHVGYPWGADRLEANDLNLAVCESRSSLIW